MVSLRYISWCDVCHTYKQGVIMDVLGLLIPIAGMSLVGFIVFINHYIEDKKSKEKYAAMIEIATKIEDQSEIKDIL